MVKGHTTEQTLTAVSKLPCIYDEVYHWHACCTVNTATHASGDLVIRINPQPIRAEQIKPAETQGINESPVTAKDNMKPLLLVALIFRLDLLQQEYQESCSESFIRVCFCILHHDIPPANILLFSL